MNNRYARRAVEALAPLLFWGGLLWLIAALLGRPLLLPTPPAILQSLLSLTATGEFWLALLTSIGRVLGGLSLGVIIGTALGITTYFFPSLSILIRPLLTVVRSTPVASFVVLIWSFTGGQMLPLIIAALMVLPIVADGLSHGLREASPALGEVATLYRLSPLRQFLIHRLPAALPSFFGAMTTSVGFAWKAGIAAEILAATSGSIGKEIYFSRLYFETDDLWAWTLAVILLSLALELFVKKTLLKISRKAGWAC